MTNVVSSVQSAFVASPVPIEKSGLTDRMLSHRLPSTVAPDSSPLFIGSSDDGSPGGSAHGTLAPGPAGGQRPRDRVARAGRRGQRVDELGLRRRRRCAGAGAAAGAVAAAAA